MPGLGDRLREIATHASPRTGFLFTLAFALLLVWIVLAAFGVAD